MKKLVLIIVLLSMLIIFSACSNEESPVLESESNLPLPDTEEFLPEAENIPEETPEEILDIACVSGKSVKFAEIISETELLPSEYAYALTDHFDRWKNLLHSPETVEIKAADGHDTAKLGELSPKGIEGIFAFLNSFEPGLFDENSELNPHTGGAIHFGAYDENGSDLWTATFNGGWLIIHLSGDEKSIIYDVDKQNIPWPDFEFLEPEEPTPVIENSSSAFEKLCDIYYTEPENAVFDTADYPGEIDTEKFTQIHQTEYYYSDGADYQMFKNDIKGGKTFSELMVPTDRFFVSYSENGTESTMELTYSDGKYVFGMRFPDDNCKRFVMPETPELSELAERLDLQNTECLNIRLLGYADGILINDGENEYFYVIGVGANSIDDMNEGDLLSAGELAEKMFG